MLEGCGCVVEEGGLKLRAERKAGEMLGRLERGAGPGRGHKEKMPDVGHLSSEYSKVLEDTDTSRQDAPRWQKIAEIPEERFEAGG